MKQYMREEIQLMRKKKQYNVFKKRQHKKQKGTEESKKSEKTKVGKSRK